MSDIGQRASFAFIRYSNCWEDADVLLAGLNPPAGGQLLSIASGGDNTFSLLTCNPSLVVAIDLNPTQLALVELKRAAFRALSHEQMLGFLGFSDPVDESRAATYRQLKAILPDSARDYWDAHPELIGQGVIHTGKFERYFRIFRQRILPLVHSRKRVHQLIAEKSPEEQERFYDETWNTLRWRWMFRFFFSRRVMGRLGRDPELFRYVEGSVADRILQRTRHALTAIPTHSNPYVRYILDGSFGDALPHYARPEHFEVIRNNLDALQLVHGTTEQALDRFPQGYHGMNLSDIFEYMTPETTAQVGSTLVDAVEPGGRVLYWNMLAPRSLASLFPEQLRALHREGSELFATDQAFFYQALHIDEAL